MTISVSEEYSLDKEQMEALESSVPLPATAASQTTLSGWDALQRSERKKEKLRKRRQMRKKNEYQRLAEQLEMMRIKTRRFRDRKAAAAYERRRERAKKIAKQVNQRSTDQQSQTVRNKEMKRELDRKAIKRMQARDIALRHELTQRQRIKNKKEWRRKMHEEERKRHERIRRGIGEKRKRSHSAGWSTQHGDHATLNKILRCHCLSRKSLGETRQLGKDLDSTIDSESTNSIHTAQHTGYIKKRIKRPWRI